MMEKDSRIYIAGHRGMVGAAIRKRLIADGYNNLILRTHSELDLTRQLEVEKFFQTEKPEYVFLAAARVGGILANSTRPANFIYDNLAIGMNIINASYKNKVTKLLNLGSSCIYPKMAPQPLKEEYLLTDSLEPTNEAYAVAKIAAIKLCKYYNEQFGTDYLSVMPTNLYGPGDNYDLETSHVLPAMIRKFHEAKINETAVTLWGDGSPFREFLYSEDLADASVFLMNNFSFNDTGDFLNVGWGEDLSIKELSDIISATVSFEGRIIWDIHKPNGTPRKLLNTDKLKKLGWTPSVSLREGINIAYMDFLKVYNG